MKHGQAATLLVRRHAKQVPDQVKQEPVGGKEKRLKKKGKKSLKRRQKKTQNPCLLSPRRRAAAHIFFHCKMPLQSVPSPLLEIGFIISSPLYRIPGAGQWLPRWKARRKAHHFLMLFQLTRYNDAPFHFCFLSLTNASTEIRMLIDLRLLAGKEQGANSRQAKCSRATHKRAQRITECHCEVSQLAALSAINFSWASWSQTSHSHADPSFNLHER